MRPRDSLGYPTRTERFFLDLFKSATLHGAAERAARREREQLLDECATIPIDIVALAKRRAIEIRQDLEGEPCEEGLLLPYNGGYRVRLRRSATEARKRFSLAHEIGHTFFYKLERDGPRHQIGVLSEVERSAEERICDLFAGALLMPSTHVRAEMGTLPANRPGEVLTRLDTIAQRFRVSLPALLQRMRSFNVASPPYLLLYLRPKLNPSTGGDFALRVEFSVSLGPWRGAFVWRNRSASGLGLSSVALLFDEWIRMSRTIPDRGRFALDSSARLAASTSTSRAGEVNETICLSLITGGKWTRKKVPVVAASRLYTWPANEQKQAYVLSVLSPLDRTGSAEGPRGH
jgi:hypothetical protein